MADYRPVSEALARGVTPAMLCSTCPWDRYCINPPTMTRQDVDAKMREAEAKDKVKFAESEGKAMPINTLLNLVTYASKDIEATICPVFALRLRSSDGRKVVDGLRATMKGWNDDDLDAAQ